MDDRLINWIVFIFLYIIYIYIFYSIISMIMVTVLFLLLLLWLYVLLFFRCGSGYWCQPSSRSSCCHGSVAALQSAVFLAFPEAVRCFAEGKRAEKGTFMGLFMELFMELFMGFLWDLM